MKAPKSDRARRILANEQASFDLVQAARQRNGHTVYVEEKVYRVRNAPRYSPEREEETRRIEESRADR